MAAHVDASELFSLLESPERHVVDQVKELIQENLNTSKEPWLLNGLIDYYMLSRSERAKDIIVAIREPNDKALFEKLNEYMKGEYRLNALMLLSFVVYKHVVWTHKIVNQPLFGTIIKCLKNDNEVPVLMCGALIITALLPSIPVKVAPYLEHIFGAFTRLVAFNISKPGNVPDVYLLHLQVGVYAMFHRLYGMYPCNFLNYLRTHYSKKESLPLFNQHIKPMLERARLHPLLVLATKDTEVSTERWKTKELHDIVIECGKVCLDSAEGLIVENSNCPIIKQSKSILDTTRDQRQRFYDSSVAEKDADMSQTSMQLRQSLELSSLGPWMTSPESLWSPSVVCGLSTPPDNLTPSTSVTDLAASMSSQLNRSGLHSTSTPYETPKGTPRETPVHVLTEENKDTPTKVNTSGMRAPPPSREPSRASGALYELTPTRKLATKSPGMIHIGTAHDTSGEIVPPSPMKKDFTSEPPLHAQRTVITKARKIDFDGSEDAKPSPKHAQEVKHAQDAKTSDKAQMKSREVKGQSSRPDGVEGSSRKVEATVSVSSLSKVIEHLPEPVEEESDEEVCGINKETLNDAESDTESLSDLPYTTESVALFMKKVNRIRFHSMTVTAEGISSGGGLSPGERSRSCPELTDKSSGRSSPTTSHKAFSTNNIETESVSTQTMVSALGQTDVDVEQLFSYGHLFSMVLPTCSSNTTQCSKCHSEVSPNSGTQADNSPPLFSTFSPSELLDRHIQLGGELHAKELSKIPLTSQTAINWTHFGGVPPVDEVNILRGQILLLHNQLMYERHKRELHAQRNRRLLGKIKHSCALEEQNSALLDQLRLQENELHNLQVSLKLQQESQRQADNVHEAKLITTQQQLKEYIQKYEDVKLSSTELENTCQRQKQDLASLQKEMCNVKSQHFTSQQEVSIMKEKVSANKHLQEQVNKLTKELVLMGELTQKYQSQLSELKNRVDPSHQQEWISQSTYRELAAAKLSVEQKNVELEACKTHLVHVEDVVKQKEMIITEQKKLLENVKSLHSAKSQTLEARCDSQHKVQQRLEAHILELYNKIDSLTPHSKPTVAVAEGSSEQ